MISGYYCPWTECQKTYKLNELVWHNPELEDTLPYGSEPKRASYGNEADYRGARAKWGAENRRLCCPERHLAGAVDAPTVRVGLWGETGGAKSVLHGAIARALRRWHWGPSWNLVADSEFRDFQRVAEAARQRTEALQPGETRPPFVVRLSQKGAARPSVYVELYDIAGETTAEAADQYAKGRVITTDTGGYYEVIDIHIMLLPPAAIPELPDNVRKPDSHSQDNTDNQTDRTTAGVFDAFVKRTGTAKDRTHVLMLTKCDRLIDIPEFPEGARLGRDMGTASPMETLDAIVEDSLALYPFVVAGGAKQSLGMATKIGQKNGTSLYLMAVGGLCGDIVNSAPRGGTEHLATRCLDPIVMGLARLGYIDENGLVAPKDDVAEPEST